ncbi:MAG: transposase [Sulfuricella sp.]
MTNSSLTPGQRALRKGRFSEAGRIYHVTATTFQRSAIFEDFRAARCLVAELRAMQDEGWANTLAWVVMPDHLHWLIELGSHDLARTLQRVKSRSAIHINRLRGTKGQFWQPGYYDHALRRDEDLREVARYIAANPLRAGLVRHLGDYPHWDAIWL